VNIVLPNILSGPEGNYNNIENSVAIEMETLQGTTWFASKMPKLIATQLSEFDGNSFSHQPSGKPLAQ
jgi:hypothetical protein